MPQKVTPCVISLGQLATVGSTEEVLSICENGGAIVSSLPVPPGTTLVISDFDCAAGGAPGGSFKLQQSNDGVSFFTIGALEVSGLGLGTWVMASPDTAWIINGNDGPAVTFRIVGLTPGGPLPVTCVCTGYRQS